MWRMAVLFRPVDGFSLRFERAEYMVGVVFDHIIINVATLGAALGSRLNINVRLCAPPCYGRAQIIPAGAPRL